MKAKWCRRDYDGKMVFLLQEEGDLQDYEHEDIASLDRGIDYIWEMFYRTFGNNEMGLHPEELKEQFPLEIAESEGWTFDTNDEGLLIDIHRGRTGHWNLPDDAPGEVTRKAARGRAFIIRPPKTSCGSTIRSLVSTSEQIEQK